MTYRVRVLFRIRVPVNQPRWEITRAMSYGVSGVVRGWVGWGGSLSEVFRDNMRKVSA